MHDANIAIIIVNWNGRDDTLNCLESIDKLKYNNKTVIVVDNGSSDDSIMAIKRNFPDCILIASRSNLGFAGGNNVGIQYALNNHADFIMLLNNDTVVEPGMLDAFLAASAGIADNSILGAKIYYYKEPQKIWYAGGIWMQEQFGFIHLGQGSVDEGERFSSIAETEYICGCALFTSADVYRTIGLLDEKYFLTFEETDFCYRARKAGIRCYLIPDAKVWHKISTSFGGENSSLFHYYLMRNKLLWAEKYLAFPLRMSMYRKVLTDLFRSFVHNLKKVEPDNRVSSINLHNNSKQKVLNEHQRQWRRVKLAQALGIRDYILRRFGECSPRVRSQI